jgi:hypothetical protein
MVRNVGCGDDVEGGARLNRPALCMTQGLCMRTDERESGEVDPGFLAIFDDR